MKFPLKITRLLPIFLAMLFAAAGTARGANSIEAVDVSSQQGGKIVVKVTLKNPPANPPAGFTVNNPPRLAFDFPDTANALGRNVQDIGEGDLRRINVVQAGARTRMVLELSRNVNYDTQIDGNALLITLQGAAAASAGATGITQHFAEPRPGDRKHSLRDIDFRRGGGGEGRIVVDLSDNQVGIDLRQQGRQIIVDFLNTVLPKNLERRLDVVDFGTPVQRINAFAQGSNTRLVIEPRGNWEHSAYQTDNRFIIEVKQLIEDPNKLVQGSRPGYSGEKLSLNFQNVEVRAVLQVIADFTGLNIITSDTVSGNLTLRLKDVPWDQALDIILQSKGLDLRKTGNVVWIAPRDELATREKLALEAQQQISDLEPTRTETFQLNYTKAEDIKQQLTSTSGGGGGTGGGSEGRLLSSRGSVIAEPRTNQLFVSDIPSRLEHSQDMIAKLDVPVRQVLIEARIVEASDTFGKSLGVKLGGADLRGIRGGDAGYGLGSSGNRVAFGGNYNAITSTTGQTDASGLTSLTSQFVNLPASGLAGATPASFAISL
ncbi:MAG: AMIN domain-containing protein, partial [Burkholderiales bacterium]|nr:AMIN domain-containing protein [Burkholderiales bacterium]